MKKLRLLKWLVFFSITIAIFTFRNDISKFIINTFIYNKNATITIEKNEYAKSRDYFFVQITDDFVAKDIQHLKNIFYTILDSGQENFFFYCDEKYISCVDDIYAYIIGDNDYNIMADINNFVHPYNSYKSIKVSTNEFGKVSLTVVKQYSPENITYVNEEIEKIKEEIITDSLTKREKILAFHDYIVNYAEYDKIREENMDDPRFKDSTTHTAYGLLETRKALCGGYTDIMAIFLSQIGVNNINISGNKHIWNLVYIDGQWFHLDVTWDDPYTKTGESILQHDYFLITTAELQKIDTKEHKFNANVYLEAK